MFFGGGTPSYLSEKQLARFLDALDRRTDFRASAEEVTLECNPESLDLDFDGQRPKRAVRLNAGAVLNDLSGGSYHRLDGAGVDVDAAYADHVVHS